MNGFVTVFYDWSRMVASYLGWLGPLAARITVGWVFLWSGWEKLQILPTMIERFEGWGIPAPGIMAPFASGVEFVGGTLLLVGLLTRFAAVPMVIVMVVAIVSAKLADAHTLEDFLSFDEVAYLVIFGWLGIAGPGPVSLDHFILKASGRDPAAHGS